MNAIVSWQKIRCLILDIDGICTDGSLQYTASGESTKTFHVHDGQGIRALRNAHIEVCIISGRTHPAVTRRFKELNVEYIFQGCQEKLKPYIDLLTTLSLTDTQIAYMGDDIPDIPLIQRAEIGISVPNAVEAVRDAADWITQRSGGQGAVREVCDCILTAQAT
jgi:3-deoxy-D-manno-octulosonate 8-phosphate phosphatase (KDO 8-P phosphatase)